MVNEVHMAQRALPVRDILDRMRHDGCGGRESLLRRIEARAGAARTTKWDTAAWPCRVAAPKVER